jgi:hypothetical protein
LLPLSCGEPVSSDAEFFIGPSGHPSQQGYIKHVVALNETFAISAADDSIGWLVGGLPARGPKRRWNTSTLSLTDKVQISYGY